MKKKVALAFVLSATLLLSACASIGGSVATGAGGSQQPSSAPEPGR